MMYGRRCSMSMLFIFFDANGSVRTISPSRRRGYPMGFAPVVGGSDSTQCSSLFRLCKTESFSKNITSKTGIPLLYHFDRSFTSRITRPHELNQFGFRHASQGPVNILKVGIAGIKKILGASRQFYEQFGQKIRSVTHHHWS